MEDEGECRDEINRGHLRRESMLGANGVMRREDPTS